MKTSINPIVAAVTFIVLTSAGSASSVQAFQLRSDDLAPGKSIPESFVLNGFGCHGKNMSPALSWRNPPSGTKSFAVMVHDPDAPTGGAGFWHWVVVNLPLETTELPRGSGTVEGSSLPATALQVATDFGTPGWGGPCPPTGDKPHRYIFTVYALKVAKLDLPPNATASLTGFMVNQNAIGKASITRTYGR